MRSTTPKATETPAAESSAPAQPFGFANPESRAYLVATTLRAHEKKGAEAQQYEARAAQLDAEIAQASGEYEKLRQEWEARGEDLKRRRTDIEAKQRELRQNKDAAEAARTVETDAARAVVSMGAPLPSPAPRGQAYGPGTVGAAGRNPFPETGQFAAAAELCQTCGDPMVWSQQFNAYIHPLEDGGYVLAGESCRRPQAQSGDTQGLAESAGAQS